MGPFFYAALEETGDAYRCTGSYAVSGLHTVAMGGRMKLLKRNQRSIVTTASVLVCLLHSFAVGQEAESLTLSQDFEGSGSGAYTAQALRRDWRGLEWANLLGRAEIVGDAQQGNVLRVSYPQGGVGPSQTGGQFVVNIPPADEYTLTYKVRFEEGFDFRLGGKLPGLTSGGSKYTGGRHPDDGDGWSARFMWREDGAAEVYLYYVDMQTQWGEQLPLQGVVLEPGKWIELKQRIRINSPDGSDAQIQAWVDGKLVMEKSGFRLRLGDQGQIDSFYFSTFHGGNTEEWGPLNDSFVRFDDFEVEAQQHAQPNFLFIMIDDLRSAGLSIYGHEDTVVAPTLERLAAEGVVFENAYANFPSCGASRASLFTGLRPTIGRFTNYAARIDVDAPDATTLPGYLKDNGYFTMSLGKIFHARGDTDHAWSVTPWDAKYEGNNATSYMDYQDPDNVEAYLTSCEKRGICSPTGTGKGPAWESVDVPDDAYIDGKTAVAAIEALEQFKADDQKFFLAVGFVKPHLPFTPPKKYWDLYERDGIAMSGAPDKPVAAPREAWHPSGESRDWYDGIPEIPEPWVQNFPDELSRTFRHGYYASTSFADAQVGRVLDALERLDLADNTVVILSSDHGWSLGDHTLWNKHSLFNVATQSPLIVRAPGAAASERVSGVVEYLDIYPTVVELAGLPKPDHLQGKSFAENLREPSAPTKPAVFVRYQKGENMHNERFSYTAWFDDGQIVSHMLYDLESDPLESRNVVDDPTYADTVKSMQTDLLRHIEEREASAAEPQPMELGKGTNLAHWLSQVFYDKKKRREFIVEDDFAYIAELGFDHVRLPIDEEQMWDEDGERDQDAFEMLHDAVRWSLKYDLKILIDLHILRSHHFNAAEKPLWTEAAAQEKFIDLWRDLSSELGDYPVESVAYELMNEPVADNSDDWNKLVARALAAVRELEPDRTIVIGSNRWQSVDTFDELDVPDDRNIILSFHFYEPFLLSHYDTSWTFLDGYTGPVHYPGVILTDEEYADLPEDQKAMVEGRAGAYFDKEVLTAMMEKPLRVAREHDLPLYCGEFGVFDKAPSGDRLRWYADMLAILEEHDVSYANWNYKSNQFGIVGSDGEPIDAMRDALAPNLQQ